MNFNVKAIYIYYLSNNAHLDAKLTTIKYIRTKKSYNLTEALSVYHNIKAKMNKFSVNKKEIKKSLRIQIKEKKLKIENELLEKCSKQICVNVAQILQDNIVKKVALYAPIEGKKEINTNYLFDILKNNGIEVYYPVIEKDYLIFYKINNLDELKPGKFDVPTPESKDLIPIEEINAFILPGLSFNPTTGARLGYGLGHYDKTLKNNSALKIGVSLNQFLNSELPSEEFDINVDCVVSEYRVHYIQHIKQNKRHF